MDRKGWFQIGYGTLSRVRKRLRRSGRRERSRRSFVAESFYRVLIRSPQRRIESSESSGDHT